MTPTPYRSRYDLRPSSPIRCCSPTTRCLPAFAGARQRRGLDIVGEAGDGAEASTAAGCADVVLMDIRMPRLDGVAATQAIVAAKLPVRVLILTTFDLDEYIVGALRAGASGFLAKDVPAEELVAAIRTVAAGDAVVAPRILRRLLDQFASVLPDPTAKPHQRLEVLTEREREVLTHIARGRSNAEIAAALSVSETTVKTHVGHVLTKLGLGPGAGGGVGLRNRAGPPRFLTVGGRGPTPPTAPGCPAPTSPTH